MHLTTSMEYRNKRFLIDRIDKRLGSLERELKFDKTMIIVGSILGILALLGLFCFAEVHPVLSLGLGVFFLFALLLTYTMAKEYFNDLKRKK